MKIIIAINTIVALNILALGFISAQVTVKELKERYPRIVIKKNPLSVRCLAIIKIICMSLLPIFNIFVLIGTIVSWNNIIEDIKRQLWERVESY